jgi:hypothetical protein
MNKNNSTSSQLFAFRWTSKVWQSSVGLQFLSLFILAVLIFSFVPKVYAAVSDIIVIPRNYIYTWGSSGQSIEPNNAVSCSQNPDHSRVLYWRTSDTDSNAGVNDWNPNILVAGEYDIYVFMPNYTHSANITTQARYYFNGSLLNSSPVDQNQNLCNWVLLGRRTFSVGTGDTISMPAQTSENPYRLISADGLLLVYIPPPTYSISGRVADYDNNPIANTTISLSTGSTTTTDVNGNYAFSGLLAGNYTLTPSHASYTTFSPASINLYLSGDTTGQNFNVTVLPILTSITPNNATRGSTNLSLQIGGGSFIGTSIVRCVSSGSISTDLFTTYNSATSLTATFPTGLMANADTFTCYVSTPGGGTSAGSGFTVNNPIPTITSISPSSITAGSAGFTLTVNGAGFYNGTSVVRWNGSNRTTTFVSATQLTASIMTSDVTTPGTANVTVYNSPLGGGTSNSATFTINYPVPTITSISPSSITAGSAGFTLTVNGTGFYSGGSVVKWNGISKATTYVNATQLTLSILASDVATPGTANVSVFNPTPGGGPSNAKTFTINYPMPTITNISLSNVTAGSAGFTLTINGTGFYNSGSVVKWNGTSKTTTFVNATQLTASILAADITTPGTANVSVSNPTPGGGTSNTQTFTINNPVPGLSGVSPNNIYVGGGNVVITATGANFVPTSTVRWEITGGSPTSLITTFINKTTLQAVVPGNLLQIPGIYNITIYTPTPGGGLTTSLPITVIMKTPSVLGITPNQGPNDRITYVEISGSNFLSSATISIGTIHLQNVTFLNNSSLVAQIPSGLEPATYDIQVCNAITYCSVLQGSFTVVAAKPILLQVLPNSGVSYIANQITIYGQNLQPGITLKIGETQLSDVSWISEHEVHAVVPSGLTAGIYDLKGKNIGANQTEFIFPKSYQVINAQQDDFLITKDDIWTLPVSPAKNEQIQVGVTIHRQGGLVSKQVKATFYRVSQSGDSYLGSATSAPMLPGLGTEEEVSISWNLAGLNLDTVKVKVIIDPENLINEANENNNLALRSFNLLPPRPDTIPPTIIDFTINNNAISSENSAVQLVTSAEDLGGSGLAWMMIKEWGYENSNGWGKQKAADWLPYQSSYTYTLSEHAGVHFLRVYVKDGAGNITQAYIQKQINYLPKTTTIYVNQTIVYRIPLKAGDSLTVDLFTTLGDADLYIFNPDASRNWPSTNKGAEKDTVAFVASEAGKYQIEVFGYETKSQFYIKVNGNIQGVADKNTQNLSEKPVKSQPTISPTNEPVSNTAVISDAVNTPVVIDAVLLDETTNPKTTLLTISGSYFKSSSVIQVNGITLDTTMKSETQLTAYIPWDKLGNAPILYFVVGDNNLGQDSNTFAHIQLYQLFLPTLQQSPADQGSSISGTVTDLNGNPLSGITITTNTGISAVSDADGRYVLAHLPTGTYTYSASGLGLSFSPSIRTATVPPNITGKNFTSLSITPNSLPLIIPAVPDMVSHFP